MIALLSVVRRRASSCVVNNLLVITIEATILIASSSNLVRMFIYMKSRSSSNLGHVGSKTRSLGQIVDKSCDHNRGFIFAPIFIKFIQNLHTDDI